ncbi:MAG: SpoIIE family protein phosphatase, partial [Eggerthellaceae bacterium]|nr:SpoIIE family protein phosphatase [Eggerthellaceae bacterium]
MVSRKREKKKTRLVLNRGLLANSERVVRVVSALVLSISCAALSFTDLGFAGIGLDGNYSAYAIVLLQPIALGALLLGTLPGAGIGLFAGVVSYAHSLVLPLDYYELAYVNAFTSIVMLTVVGFLLGVLFAFVLRNNPSQVRRVIYILLVCGAVSTIYSLVFATNVIVTLIEYLAESGMVARESVGVDPKVQALISSTAMSIGDVSLQIVFDALIMTILCCIADYVVRRSLRRRGPLGLRAKFLFLLAVAVLAVFMVTSGGGFVAITQGSIADAETDMSDEVKYLCNQLRENTNQQLVLGRFLESAQIDLMTLSDENFDALATTVSYKHLLNGYSKSEDGIVIVLLNDLIVISDDDHFEPTTEVSDYFSPESVDAIKLSAATGTIKRIVFDERYGTTLKEAIDESDSITSQLAYVVAAEAEGAFIGDDFQVADTPNDSDAKMGNYTVMIMRTADMVFRDRSNVMFWTTLLTFILLSVVFALTALLLNRIVARRIDETNGVLARVTEGDLDARVAVRDTVEFESLSDRINGTVVALKGWIKEAETRMDAELATAKAIQESALPRIFPPFPDILRFDIYATMNAAKEVGGDFYDFFLIGDDCTDKSGKLGFIVADVSGKGVPAALFMMQAKTLIRDYLENGVELGEAIENVNRQLCDGNESGMFVTAWVGVLEYATGHVDYVNAGHNPPLFWQDGQWRWLEDRSGLPLGLFDGLPYEAFSVDCSIGDQFLLYTDGVTEAMSEEGELYGEDRLKKKADESFVLHPRELVNGVRQSVAKHAGGAEQSDDITMLALEVGVPPEITATLIVEADVDELPHVNRFIHTELDRRLCPLKVQHQLDIAVEELFVNVAHYAYPNATPERPGMVRVSYTYSADPPSVTVDISDDGVPYDPLAKPDAVTPDNIEDVP